MQAGDEDVAVSDAELLEHVRANDLDALGELYARHHEAALRVAHAVTSDPGYADDLVSSAFERIHGALQRGHGPTDAFRPYLYTVIRRLAAERAERSGHEQDVDDWAPLERGLALLPADTAEAQLVSTAFTSLPERHQAVLWHLDVEGMHPAEAAPIFGLSANAISRSPSAPAMRSATPISRRTSRRAASGPSAPRSAGTSGRTSAAASRIGIGRRSTSTSSTATSARSSSPSSARSGAASARSSCRSSSAVRPRRCSAGSARSAARHRPPRRRRPGTPPSRR